MIPRGVAEIGSSVFTAQDFRPDDVDDPVPPLESGTGGRGLGRVERRRADSDSVLGGGPRRPSMLKTGCGSRPIR